MQCVAAASFLFEGKTNILLSDRDIFHFFEYRKLYNPFISSSRVRPSCEKMCEKMPNTFKIESLELVDLAIEIRELNCTGNICDHFTMGLQFWKLGNIGKAHLAWADFEIKVKRIAHSIVHFDQWNKLISKM